MPAGHATRAEPAFADNEADEYRVQTRRSEIIERDVHAVTPALTIVRAHRA